MRNFLRPEKVSVHEHWPKPSTSSPYVCDISLDSYVEEAIKATTVENLHALCWRLMANQGYDYYVYGMVVPVSYGKYQLHLIYSDQSDWTNHYRTENYLRDDPFISHCLKHVSPIVWDSNKNSDFGMTSTQTRMLQKAREFGIKNIVVLPIHGSFRDLSFLQVSITKGHVVPKETILNMMPTLSFVARFLHEAAYRILVKNCEPAQTIYLTPREKEVLVRVADGENTSEISDTLKISENTVLAHMKKIHLKLDVKSRSHAIAKAITLGLLTP